MGHRVVGLYSDLRQRIVTGALEQGAVLPSVRELARKNGVSTFTAARAYDVLVAEGFVDARRGAGHYVARTASLVRTAKPLAPEQGADSIWPFRRTFDPKLVRLDAGCGWLPANWLFADGVRTALARISRRPGAYAARYGNPYGLRALRRHLATKLSQHAIECTEEQIVLTQGASQALDLCISVLTKPGDAVLVDDPCYPYLLAMLRARGVRVIGVPRTDSGPDPHLMHSMAEATRARVFITNTSCHNPTGTTTSPQVAHDVLMVARNLGITVVEDDIFAELSRDRPTSLASLDRLRDVVYVGSFSKTIAPNLRVGFIVASGGYPDKFAALKNVFSLSSSELSEQIVLSILTGGRHRTHLEALRSRLTRNYEKVTRRLTAAGAEIPFRGSGVFLWAKLPTDMSSTEIIRAAKAQGILLAPGEAFRAGTQPCAYFRFNVAFADDELLYSFVETLPRLSSRQASL